MSRGVNKVILIGNLGSDPESRQTKSGEAVATLSVATSESWKDKQTGQRVEKTEWHRVVAFSRLAEICQQYLHKGSKIYIEGQIRTRKWQADDGTDRYTTEIVARTMQMLDSRGDQGAPAQQQAPAQDRSGHAQQAQQKARQQAHEQPPQDNDPFDDDIPF